MFVAQVPQHLVPDVVTIVLAGMGQAVVEEPFPHHAEFGEVDPLCNRTKASRLAFPLDGLAFIPETTQNMSVVDASEYSPSPGHVRGMFRDEHCQAREDEHAVFPHLRQNAWGTVPRAAWPLRFPVAPAGRVPGGAGALVVAPCAALVFRSVLWAPLPTDRTGSSNRIGHEEVLGGRWFTPFCRP